MTDRIIKEVCEEFGVTESTVFSRDQKREYAYPRHMIALLLREHTDMTLVQIGVQLDRHYSTIIASLEEARNLIEAYPPFRSKYENIISKLEVEA